jgi:hypothetical protein
MRNREAARGAARALSHKARVVLEPEAAALGNRLAESTIPYRKTCA